jgi:hypothetical protein
MTSDQGTPSFHTRTRQAPALAFWEVCPPCGECGLSSDQSIGATLQRTGENTWTTAQAIYPNCRQRESGDRLSPYAVKRPRT